MTGELEILRSTDPRAVALLAAGWTVVAESWGARLRLGDRPVPAGLPVDDLPSNDHPALAAARSAVVAAERAGYAVRELGADWTTAVTALEAATHDDYPEGPAVSVPHRSEDDVRALWADGGRVFGAVHRDGDVLAAVTVIARLPDRAETDFTSVHPDHRRRGLAVAVKGASVLALAATGVRVFGTGGAQVNAGSIRMNERLGYRIEERWLSVAPPAAPVD